MSEIEVQGFNHIAIWVTNIRKSADWYIEHLGMKEANSNENHIFLKLANGQVLALFQSSDSEQVGSGVQHLAFNLPPGGVEEALDTLRKKNIPVSKRGPSYGFADPDGYWIHFS